MADHTPQEAATLSRADLDLSLVVVALMKGVVYRDSHERAWRHLQQLQSPVRDYVAVMGLTLLLDEAEGYAFLRSPPEDPDQQPAPRLVARHSLSFPVSLLLALLRKKLAEFDATSADSRLVLTRDQIVELLRVFTSPHTNEARLVDQIDAHITKVATLGFLRRVTGQESTYVVSRVLKAFVDGQWLAEFDQRLAEYAGQLGVTPGRDE